MRDTPRGWRFRPRELLYEACAGVTARPGRSALTALGTVLGVAALVATIGLASTAGAQILTRIDALSATDVRVEPASGGGTLSWDAPREIERLNGVTAAGSISPIVNLVGVSPIVESISGGAGAKAGVLAVSPSVWATVGAEVERGRLLNDADDSLRLANAVLGEAAALRLGITDIGMSPTLFIDSQPVAVVGILQGTRRRPELSGSILVTNGYASDAFGLSGPASIQVETTLGANEQIRDQIPLLLAPNDPSTIRSSSPPLPKRVRANISSDVTALLLTLGGVALLVGAFSIANVTLVSVLERTGEIGLRRALGAGRSHIGLQFLAESMTVGFVGGAIGSAVGTVGVVVISVVKDWHPVLPLLPSLGSPVAGAMVGLFAGLYPAWRASGVEPASALRA